MKPGMANFWNGLLGSRFWALFRKEVNQILHNRQLLVQLLLPPTIFLILFGYTLNPTFKFLKVGITDYSHSRASREFIELFRQTDAFVISRYYASQQDMLVDLSTGKLTVGVTLPPEFDRDIARKRTAQVQAAFDAVDANTANVASNYLSQLVSDYNQRYPNNNQQQQNQVQVQTSVFYNPGLEASWFIVPGTLGILMTVLGSQAASSLVVREKEAGTLEQLMMTPASNTQVILAKICPLLILLTIDALIALTLGMFVFHLPFRGNFLLFMSISLLYFFVGISIGIMIATYAKSEQQAQLTAFFINPPLVLLSGALSPIAGMPPFMQWLSYLDPMRYYIEESRGILLKGIGLEALWSQVLILLVFATVLLTLSIRQFRQQLS
jgi:ABC-2 type transport system permease protein